MAVRIPLSHILPDGRRLALIVTSGSRIWLRNLDGLAALPLAGTEGARALFWAPDSDQLAFTTARELKKLRRVRRDGPAALRLLPARRRRHMEPQWDDRVHDSGRIAGRIRPDGGELQAADPPGSIARGDHPPLSLFPAGWRAVSLSETKQGRDPKRAVRSGRIGYEEAQLLLDGDFPAIYANPGYLLFLRGGTLMAQRFDPGA